MVVKLFVDGKRSKDFGRRCIIKDGKILMYDEKVRHYPVPETKK